MKGHDVKRKRRAFTLIELIAVIVVLAILAGVALPKYFDYATQARESACKGGLGGVRAGVANFYANSAIMGTPTYPTVAQMTTLGTVMQEALPENPYNALNTVQSQNALQAAARATDGITGWNYYVDNSLSPPTYTFWANSDVDDGNIDEHDF